MFTFVHSGCDIDRIDLLPLYRAGYEEEDRVALRKACTNFDAEKCQCFNCEDKDRMFTIILAAFGSMKMFNNVVRTIIAVIDHGLQSHGSDSELTDSSSEDQDSEG